MATTTITLERSAHELLRGEKRAGESFSEVVQRVLGPGRPSLRNLLELFSPEDGRAIGKTMERLKRDDLAAERLRLRRGGPQHGRRR